MGAEVIDLLSSSDSELPKNNTLRGAHKAKWDFSALKQEPELPKEPPQIETSKPAKTGWITISSDDESPSSPKQVPAPLAVTVAPAAGPPAYKPAPKRPSPPPKPSRELYILSDDLEIIPACDNEVRLPGPFAKRRRLSPVASTTDHAPKPRQFKKSVSAMAPGKEQTGPRSFNVGGMKRSKTTSTVLESDPIMFTSSPDPFKDVTVLSKKNNKKGTFHVLGKEDIDSDPFEGIGRELGARVSETNTKPIYAPFDGSSDDLPELRNLDFKLQGHKAKDSMLYAITKFKDLKPAEETLEKLAHKTKNRQEHKIGEGGGVKPKLSKEEREQKALEKTMAKEAEQERKRFAREEKAREKESAAILTRLNVVRDRKTSSTEMIVDLPSCMDPKLSNQLSQFLAPYNIEHASWENSTPVIRWRRKVTAKFNDTMDRWEPVAPHVKTEDHILCILQAQEFINLVTGEKGSDLDSHFARLKSRYQDCKVIYLLEGVRIWMRKNKNVKNRQFTAAVRSHFDEPASSSQKSRSKKKEPEYIDEDAVEDALLRLQIVHGALIHHTAAMMDSAEWILSFTQHISTIPYKNQKQSLDTTFCMESGQVKAGEDAADTYVKMLQEISRLTAPVAYGIATEYDSLQKLARGLEEHGPLALADCHKSANRDGAFSDRRVGPAISKRVHKIFLGRDPASLDV